MGGKFIIDTNAIIEFRVGNKGIVEIFSEADTLFLPVIVLGELLYGAKNSSNVKNNLDFIEKFSEYTIAVSIDSQIAEICKKLNLPILTKDLHFKLIKGIMYVNW